MIDFSYRANGEPPRTLRVASGKISGVAVQISQGSSFTAVHLPCEQVAALVQQLLELPAVVELAGGKPLVLYFHTDADRQAMVDAIMAEHPNMISRSVSL